MTGKQRLCNCPVLAHFFMSHRTSFCNNALQCNVHHIQQGVFMCIVFFSFQKPVSRNSHFIHCTKFNHCHHLNTKMRHMAPIKKEIKDFKQRKTNTFKVNRTNTERYKSSSIPYMQNLLNQKKQLPLVPKC